MLTITLRVLTPLYIPPDFLLWTSSCVTGAEVSTINSILSIQHPTGAASLCALFCSSNKGFSVGQPSVCVSYTWDVDHSATSSSFDEFAFTLSTGAGGTWQSSPPHTALLWKYATDQCSDTKRLDWYDVFVCVFVRAYPSVSLRPCVTIRGE